MMIVGSRVRSHLLTRFENLDFVRNLLFSLLKIPLMSGVTGEERGHLLKLLFS